MDHVLQVSRHSQAVDVLIVLPVNFPSLEVFAQIALQDLAVKKEKMVATLVVQEKQAFLEDIVSLAVELGKHGRTFSSFVPHVLKTLSVDLVMYRVRDAHKVGTLLSRAVTAIQMSTLVDQ